jgi:hypothetical protein
VESAKHKNIILGRRNKMAVSPKANTRKFSSLMEDIKTASESGVETAYGRVAAGYYGTSLPTLTNGDFGFFRLTSDGKLMVDTELTVDGNVIVDNVAVWATNISDSSTSSFALVDASGHPQVDVLTMPGGLTGYAEDAAHTTGEIGVMALAVRNDAGASLVDTDGDYAPLMVNAYGMLNTNFDMIRDVAPTVNGGNRDAGVQTFTLADDDPAVTALEIMDDWDAVEDAAIGTDGVVFMAKARSTQQAAVAEDDAVIPVTNLVGELKIAGHDSATNSNRVEETDPISSHHVEETLADVTNGADATYYYYFDMDGFKYFTTQLTLNGGSGTCTATVEATIQDDGTAPASCTYVDITLSEFGAASFTASDMLIGDVAYGFKYVRIKIVASTGAADDADWTIYNKKLY